MATIRHAKMAVVLLVLSTVIASTVADAGEAGIRQELEKAFKAAQEGGESTISLPDGEIPDLAQEGDLARIGIQAATEDGTVIVSSMKAESSGKKTGTALVDTVTFDGPVVIPTDHPAILPGLSDAVLGMEVGQKKQVVFSPAQGFGERDNAAVSTYSRVKIIPRRLEITRENYRETYGEIPELGRAVSLFPYAVARLEETRGEKLVFTVLLPEKDTYQETFGTTRIAWDDESLFLTLIPTVGSVFENRDSTGYVVGMDEETFTVDYNHPLAGKAITVNIELLSLVKASEAVARPIGWVDDYEAGMAESSRTGKNFFLLLYRESCPWCRKMFRESLAAPLVQNLSEHFVWGKVDTEINGEYKKAFGQTSSPTMIIFNENGEELKRIKGYRDPFDLRLELEPFMDGRSTAGTD